MYRKRTIWTTCAVWVAFVCAGCERSGTLQSNIPGGRSRELTAQEYINLNDRQKVAYKDVVIRVPAQWGGALLPFDEGPYESVLDKAVHSGELATLMALYNQSLFELQHPRVKLEYVNFDMWSDNFRSALAVALASRRAPAYYVARDLPQSIEQGMFADITDLVKGWDQAGLQPEGTVREGTVDGKVYVISSNQLAHYPIIRYRKDWFREAGIFNERGEPGPPADWTWEDFRQIAKKLTDRKKGRYGYAAEMFDFLYRQAYGLDLLIMPDPSGKRTWVFNDRDPELIRSLQVAREMVNRDGSVSTSVAMGWFEWHNEFDASHAAMVPSFSAHVPSDSVLSPYKFGEGKLYSETVGMALPPRGPAGLYGVRPGSNAIGFDPTLSKEQLSAALEWCKSYFYGDVFVNRMRADIQDTAAKGKPSVLYAELLTLPFRPKENLLDRPLTEVFPRDYLEVYRTIRESKAPPLPREFGLKEPATNEFDRQLKAMYQEAITSKVDLKQLIRRTASRINTNLLNFGGPEDRERLQRFIDARGAFYQQHYPRFYESVWKERLRTYMKVAR